MIQRLQFQPNDRTRFVTLLLIVDGMQLCIRPERNVFARSIPS
jgi:hypothetical protein